MMRGSLRLLPLLIGLRYREDIIALVLPLLQVFFTHIEYLNNPYARQIAPGNNTSFDFLVVGSGAGGSAVAGRLAEDGSQSVLVLESGGTPSVFSYIPSLVPFVLQSDETSHYDMEKQENACFSCKNQTSPMPIGHSIGGSTAINVMIYTRGDAFEFNHWGVDLNNTGWDYESILPYLKKLETYLGPTTKDTENLRGKSGPLKVTKPRISTKFQRVFKRAVQENGLDIIDYNAHSQIGFNTPDQMIHNGMRYSAAEAYLKPALGKTKLNVLPNSHVTKIIFDENKRAVGLKYVHRGKEMSVYANKEVILSAGALNSPKLLMLSGIGPKSELEKLGIPLVADVAGVGENLHDHVGITGGLTWLRGKLPGTRLADVYNPFSYLQYRLFGTGPLAKVFGLEMTGFISLEGDPDVADIQTDIFSAGLTVDGGLYIYDKVSGYTNEFFQEYFSDIMGNGTFAMDLILMRPKSRGRVFLQSTDPFHNPKFDLKLLSHPDDVRMLGKGIKYLKTFGETNSLKREGVKFHDKPIPGCNHLNKDTDEYWECFGKVLGRSYFHPVGTCKMAQNDDPMGVVDKQLRVRKVSNLRVVDASVMPTITPGNTEVPVIMIGEKAADMIKEDWRLNLV